nr:IAP-5 [Darna trima granulovirus]
MDVYENRLNSLTQWPGTENREMLALVGFYYTGHSDLIVCYYCRFDSYNYISGDEDTLRDHKRYSPDCPFFMSNVTNYVNTKFVSPRIINTQFNVTKLHPLSTHSDYSLTEHRINSFVNFPRALNRLVIELCAAGFYYTNVGDAVCCYACNVVAKDFIVEGCDVWKLHKTLNNKCPLLYVKRMHVPTSVTDEETNYDYKTPSAPEYDDGHYSLPKCIRCKKNRIDAVLLPCFHLCVCRECAITCTMCNACNVFTGGFFAVKIPTSILNVVEHEQLPNGIQAP